MNADHHFARRSSSACAKYADAIRRISFARRSSTFSRSSSLNRARSSVVSPGRRPPSRSACRTQLPQRLGRAADLLGDRGDRRPLRRVVLGVLEHHPHRSLPHLRGKPTRSRHDPILSRNGASGKPGAVHEFCAHPRRLLVKDAGYVACSRCAHREQSLAGNPWGSPGVSGGAVSCSGHSAAPSDTIPGHEERNGIGRVNIFAKSAQGIPVACASRRCPRATTWGDAQALPQEDPEMKPVGSWSAALARSRRRSRACLQAAWPEALGDVSHAGPDRAATPTPLTPTQGDWASGPEPSVDEEPHDDD